MRDTFDTLLPAALALTGLVIPASGLGAALQVWRDDLSLGLLLPVGAIVGMFVLLWQAARQSHAMGRGGGCLASPMVLLLPSVGSLLVGWAAGFVVGIGAGLLLIYALAWVIWGARWHTER